MRVSREFLCVNFLLSYLQIEQKLRCLVVKAVESSPFLSQGNFL